MLSIRSCPASFPVRAKFSWFCGVKTWHWVVASITVLAAGPVKTRFCLAPPGLGVGEAELGEEEPPWLEQAARARQAIASKAAGLSERTTLMLAQKSRLLLQVGRLLRGAGCRSPA